MSTLEPPAGSGPAHAATTPVPAPAPTTVARPAEAPAQTARPSGAGGPPAARQSPDKQVAPTRAGMVWVSVCVAVLLAIALIIFLAQNTRTVAVHFLGLSGSTSLALMMLIAAVAGALITVIAGSARIIQLRRRAKSH